MSNSKIKVALFGYGNLAKGAEAAIANSSDMELFGIFTRRNPENVKPATNTKVFSDKNIADYKYQIDVIINCGGSATDLPKTTPILAQNFNVVDSFDTHAKIPEHFKNTDAVAKKSGKLAVISVGWDPGMFSVNRLYSNAILPQGKDYTFWGRGVSQGHSDAIRRIEGVIDARQYTVPVKESIKSVLNGQNPELSTRQKHTRECYVVTEPGADLNKIEEEIVNMPNYFADYDTSVTFISAEEMQKNHKDLPHGGKVIRTGKTGLELDKNHVIEYSLQLDSNPQFTGSVLSCFARATYSMNKNGESGCKTIFDIPPAMLSDKNSIDLISNIL